MSRTFAMLGRPTYYAIAVGVLSLLSACSDHLTVPEAKAVLDAVEQPFGHGGLRDRLWTRMGWRDGLSRIRNASRVRVWQRGKKHTYVAVVFERIMVPTAGSGRSSCLGPRWTLFLWRETKDPEGFVLTGGQFDQPLSPVKMCSDISFSDPTPGVIWYPPASTGELPAWISDGGRGEITPGEDVGGCDFLSATEADMLYQDTGVTCGVTRHRVNFQSTMYPVAVDGDRDRKSATGNIMEAQLDPVEVLGVRYTINCALPQAAEMCRQAHP